MRSKKICYCCFFIFHFPDIKKHTPMIIGINPARESPYQKPSQPILKAKPKSAAIPIRPITPSIIATKRFRFVFPEPFISEKLMLLVQEPKKFKIIGHIKI